MESFGHAFWFCTGQVELILINDDFAGLVLKARQGGGACHIPQVGLLISLPLLD